MYNLWSGIETSTHSIHLDIAMRDATAHYFRLRLVIQFHAIAYVIAIGKWAMDKSNRSV